MLDLNELAEGQKFMALGAYAVSDDGNLLAYSTDDTGFREYTLYVKDLRDRRAPARGRVEKVGSVAWAADNQTLFYAVEDERQAPVPALPAPRWAPASTTSSTRRRTSSSASASAARAARRTWCSASGSLTTTEVRVLPADEPERRVAGRGAARARTTSTTSTTTATRFYIRTNDTRPQLPAGDGAGRRRPAARTGQEVVPHRAGRDARGRRLLRRTSTSLLGARGRAARSCASRTSRTGDIAPHRVPGAGLRGVRRRQRRVRHRARSASATSRWSRPRSVVRLRRGRRATSTLLKEQPVLGGYDRTQYASERLFATAPDGAAGPDLARLPRRACSATAARPLLLYGYGSYGLPAARRRSRRTG